MTAYPLRLLAFDGAFNLPIWIGQSRGVFAAHGLAVSLAYTPNSRFLVQALMNGEADIGLCGFDNIAAYQLGQGEAELPEPPDLRAFMGGDGGFLALVARPEIASLQALAGCTLSVDALTTGFAFVLRDMLAQAGLGGEHVRIVSAGGTAARYQQLLAGAHDATLLRVPYERLAASRGFRILAQAGPLIGPYIGTVGAARQRWLAAHAPQAQAFMRAYREAIDWLHVPAHRAEACDVLMARHEGLDAAAAGCVLDDLLASDGGLQRDLSLDPARVRGVLAIRARHTALKDMPALSDLLAPVVPSK
ncbi:ABC transporter substrate-binding protein [Pseudacidovorax sp. NFM-22]|uniref:ABC transporter substrate-binding protein n=1 Tax=Pseudacidovorax sp. NFM-22 TaxID=2744469 RepID=UPI001F158F07|nr:ABC transporter substrate-binding protein [Pseudacidovorax sp. NFM-22]